ncbi:MAG: NAD(P)-dependent oxidoreductase [Bacteroidota bacterium]|nr:NAD(P)-dependent oxidoreductase [Bacteroidota bacterium]MDP4231455.1 NAD(P)-dependent oxidoreductase [Bacteroidota bacterium]MDP4235003.1 NAD(P)-dependent oxidoreductase [Bacteroidota bacterium]
MISVVTGGSGFLGKVLVSELKKLGHTVINIDKRSEPTEADRYVETDIREPSPEAIEALQSADNVIHLAANQFNKDIPKWKEREYFFSTNVGGTRKLLEILSHSSNIKHFLFVSTDMTYGVPQRSPVDEQHPTNPLGYYGESKKGAEKLIQEYMEGKCSWTIFRPRLILGPGRLGVMVKLFKIIRNGKPVPVIGKGLTRYQMISVFDLAHAITLALAKHAKGIYNLGSDNPPVVKELLKNLIIHAGSKSRLLHLPQSLTQFGLDFLYVFRLSPLFPEQYKIASIDYILDTSKAKRDLGWQSRFTDQQMMTDAYDYYVAKNKG